MPFDPQREPIEISMKVIHGDPGGPWRMQIEIMVPGDETIFASVHPVAGVCYQDAAGGDIEDLVPESLRAQVQDEILEAFSDLRYMLYHLVPGRRRPV